MHAEGSVRELFQLPSLNSATKTIFPAKSAVMTVSSLGGDESGKAVEKVTNHGGWCRYTIGRGSQMAPTSALPFWAESNPLVQIQSA